MCSNPVTVFALACELGAALGWENISLDAGCREHQVNAHWWFAMNPHRTKMLCTKGIDVKPYSIYFEWDGWPAGMVTAAGGMFVQGIEANQDNLIAALKAAIATNGQPA